LKLAGKDFSELEHERLRTYTRFFIALEGVLSLAMVLFGALLAKGEYRFVVIMLALNMMFVNITTYYQFLSQATQRFREYSAKSLIVSLLKVLFVGALFVLDYFDITAVSHRIYLIGLNVLDLGMAVWYVAIYRGITFGKGLPIRFLKDDIRDIFKTGIVLTLAYQVSHLVLALDRQFVNLLFSMEVFSVYSFAYNIVGMISTMISSLSIVLLPMLKRCTKEDVVGYYRTSMTVVSIVTAGALLCYFPFASLIEWFLPQYAGALEYIAIVLPTLLFTSGISVVMFTVEKVLDRSFAFF
jgi:O-antigen/teichoic acid export membrane protein